jgi:hypothetical protein
MGGMSSIGTAMMFGGTALGFASNLMGGAASLTSADIMEQTYNLYEAEASIYDRQAEMWSQLDLTPFYDRQAELYVKQADVMLSAARERAAAHEAAARARSQEAETILKIGEYNATASEIDALAAERRTYRQLEQVSDEASKLLGRQVTLVAKSGVTQTSGSVLEVLMETVSEAERSLRDITVEGRLEARKVRLTGDIARISALGEAARAKGRAGGEFAQAGAAFAEGAAGARQALFGAEKARMDAFQSVLQGTLRAQEARTRAEIARMRGQQRAYLGAYELRQQGYQQFFGAGSSLLAGAGRILTR